MVDWFQWWHWLFGGTVWLAVILRIVGRIRGVEPPSAGSERTGDPGMVRGMGWR